jgi:beta-glucosidase
MFSMGFFDEVPDKGSADTPEHRDLALKVAQESIVLLKNDQNVLPFDLEKIKTIAVIGPNADVARTGGGGSSRIRPYHTVSPLDGLSGAGTDD